MLGSTVPTVGGLPMAFTHAAAWGCECCQIYTTLSRRWEVNRLRPGEAEAFEAAWRASGVIEVVSHVPFLVNIATPDDEMRRKSLERLRIEVERAGELGIRWLVLHGGSSRGAGMQDALKRVVEGLDTVLAEAPARAPRVLIETMAGQGNLVGSRFEELAHILGSVEKPEMLGVCFDIAHVFQAGYDISGFKGYERVMEEFDGVVGASTIGVLHINDSKTRLGSRHDRHAHVGEGELGLDTFAALVRDGRFTDTPKLLEVPPGPRIKEDLDLLRALQHGA